MSVAEDLKKLETPEQKAERLRNHYADQERARRAAKRLVDDEQRPPFNAPDAFTLSELIAQPEEETRWRITSCQPAGTRVMLSAQYKAGKTTMVGNLVRSLVDGDSFLGKHAVVAVNGTVALLDFEMGKNQLRRWLCDQQIKHAARVLVLPMRGKAASFDLRDPDVKTHWVNFLRENHVEYLIVDCLRPILDALGLDEHHDVGAFLVPLDALIVEAGIADALVVHHMGHQNERARGDSRLRDWPDVEWSLVRIDNDDPASDRFFKAYGRDVEVPEARLGYDAPTRRLTVEGGSRHDVKVDDAVPAVIEFIRAANARDHEPSRNDIVDGLSKSGHSQKNVKDAIKRAVAEGRIATKAGTRNSQLHSIVTEAVGQRTKQAEM
jgi:hypothetical protein